MISSAITMLYRFLYQLFSLLCCTGRDVLYNNCKLPEIYLDQLQVRLRRILNNAKELYLAEIEENYL